MVNSSDVQRARRTWWAGSLSMVLCLGAIVGPAAQERLPANPAASPEAEVALSPAPGEISVRTGDPLKEAVADVWVPLVRYLIKELISQRLVNAQLSADLEIGGPHDELAQQLADTTAARVEIEPGPEDQARVAKEASARASRQLATMKDRLQERGRQSADVRSETEGLRQRLDDAYAELERKGAENNGLAAELLAVRMTTNSAAVMAQENLAAIEDQKRVLHAAAGDTALDRPEQSAELPSSTLVDVLPVMPFPKPRLRAGEGDAWAPASNTADGGAPARAETITVIEDDASIQASFLDVAVGNWEPTTAHAISTAPDRPEIPDMTSTAALAPAPFASGTVAPDESGATHGSAGPIERADRWGLNEAAARLADGLTVTREEAMSQRQERVFTVDVEERAFAANSTAEPVPLDPALNIHLVTAKSELVGESRGGIRFFADGSSTGGRIELELLGDRAAINVQWATGVVTVER